MNRLAFVLVLLCSTRPAAAQEVEETRTVEVVSTSTVDLEELVQELLRQFPVTLHWTRVAAVDPREVLAHRAVDPRVVARVWLDLSDPHRAYLYVVNASERFIVRQVPLQSGYDEIARESLAHILESVVDALLSGADIGVSRELAERQLAERLPSVRAPLPPPRTSRLPLSAAVYYRAGTWSGDDAVHQPGLALGLSFPPARRLRGTVWLWASYVAPLTWQGARAGAAFTGASVRLTAGLEAKVHPRVTLRAVAGPGLDALEVQSRPGPGIHAVRPFWTLAPMLTVVGMVDVRLGGPLSLVAGIGIEADLAGTHYDILLADGTPQTTLSPWPLRPFGFLGFAISR